MPNKSYRYRLYPTDQQASLIRETFGCVRFVYNYYLSKRIELYDNDNIIFGYCLCSSDMTQLKKQLPWLSRVDSTALASSIKDLDVAYSNFFRKLKNGDSSAFPKFKNKRDKFGSYRSSYSKGNIKVLGKDIQIPKLGFVKSSISRPINGRILSATISQTLSGKYFISICCTDADIKPMDKTGTAIGIDLGIKSFISTSHGDKIQNNRFLEVSQKRINKLQRELSRKPSDSLNREKSRIKLARAYEKVSNQRLDASNKLSTKIISENDIICIENLQIRLMMKDRKFSRIINDASWGMFVRQLEYKAKWYGKTVVKVDSLFASSQTCSTCGSKCSITKKPSIREWDCPNCGTHHDRDVNAAKNILNEGLRILATQ